jgi:hypothetical protein
MFLHFPGGTHEKVTLYPEGCVTFRSVEETIFPNMMV